MSLKDNLYVPLSADSSKTVVRLLSSSPVYAAHFPGYPITPGVLLVQLATELLEERESVSLELSEVVNVKFSAPVFPSEGNSVTFCFSPDGPMRWKVTVDADGVLCARMTLQYGPAI